MNKKILSLCAGLFSIYCMFMPMRSINKIHSCGVVFSQREDYQESIATTGKIETLISNEIFIPVPVIAQQVNFEIGDKVKKGEVIAKIDVEKTKNVLENSITSVSSSVVADEQIVQTFKSTAQKFGINLSDIGSLDEISSKIKSVEKTKSSTIPSELFAPSDGTVTQINIKENSLCQASGAIAKIEDLTHKKAKLSVSEFDIERVQIGQPVVITSRENSLETASGTVSKIYPTAVSTDQGASSVIVEVEIDDCPEILKPGFNVTANILINEAESSLSLPYEVIRQDKDNMEYVYTLENGRAKKTYIKTGIEMQSSVQILEGVDKHTPVLDNPDNLSEGELVLVKGV